MSLCVRDRAKVFSFVELSCDRRALGKHPSFDVCVSPSRPLWNQIIDFVFVFIVCFAEGQEDTILSYEPVIRQESK